MKIIIHTSSTYRPEISVEVDGNSEAEHRELVEALHKGWRAYFNELAPEAEDVLVFVLDEDEDGDEEKIRLSKEELEEIANSFEEAA